MNFLIFLLSSLNIAKEAASGSKTTSKLTIPAFLAANSIIFLPLISHNGGTVMIHLISVRLALSTKA